MRGVLEELLSSIYASNNADGRSPVSSIWVSADESEAVSSALAPKLRQAEEGVEKLLFEVVTLQVGSLILKIPFLSSPSPLQISRALGLWTCVVRLQLPAGLTTLN